MKFPNEHLQTLASRESESQDSFSFSDSQLRWEEIAAKERRAPPPADQNLFEFIFNLNAPMCPADDIFLSEKIVPYSFKPPAGGDPQANLRRRSLSLEGILRQRGGAEDRLRRTTYSADYQRLESVSDSEKPKRGGNWFGGHDFRATKVSSSTWPKWHGLRIGLVKAPGEMEMSDIRNRQRRRNPSPIAGISANGVRGEGNKARWKLLSILSCRRHEAIAVR